MSKLALLCAVLALSACAPVIWSRPDTPPQMAEMDRARCQLMANGMTQTVDHTSVFHTAGQNLGDSIADGIINGLEKGENFVLCMRANGYAAARAQ
jgi:hypothetical protein